MRPMIKYRGGRTREIPHIMWHIPRFSGRYVEPFFGGGALFFYLEPREAVISDVNKQLINFYRGVRDYFPKLRKESDEIEALYEINRRDYDILKASTPNERVVGNNETLYYLLRDMFNNKIHKEYNDILLYYLISKTAYSGMIRYSSDGEFDTLYGRYKHSSIQQISFPHSQLLRRAKIHNVDYSKIFDMCNVDGFIFLDPPYNCVFLGCGNVGYKEGFNEDNHRKLAEDFKSLSRKSLMVIGKTPLTEELYRELIIGEYKKTYTVNIRNRFKSETRHIVVTNYKEDWDNVQIAVDNVDKECTIPETTQIMLFESRKKYHDKN